jgi:predicted dehydrogenase
MVRWGILGAANIAPRIISAIRAANAGTVAAIGSRTLERAQSFAREQSIPHAYGSYEALLASKEIDVIYNPLPNSLHAEWSCRALEAGFPVLCEKPFTTTLADARRVARVARKMKLPVAEAFMYRFHPLWDHVRAVIEGGRIGALVSISSRFTFFNDDPASITASLELGGGPLMDVGCYSVDLSRQLAESEPRRATSISTGETFFGAMYFDNGVLANLECSIAAFERHGAEIVGTHGSIEIASPWFPGLEEARFVLRTGDRLVELAVPGGDGYQLEVLDFARAVREGSEPRWPIEDAVANVAALEMLTNAGPARSS